MSDASSAPTAPSEGEPTEGEPTEGEPTEEGGDEPGPEMLEDLARDDLVGLGRPTVEELIDTVATLTAERDTHLADLQRVSAEFANFRRQNEKRQAELIHQAAARLAEELLPVLDACDAAVQQGVEGIEPVREQLLSVLHKAGLETLAEIGEPFDPHRHEAAMTQPATDSDDGQDEGQVVAEVLRAGYGWNGRVLRAAMVAVRG